MGMFDTYETRLPLQCPACGVELSNWQGKDGPCGLFVWREGEPNAVSQGADESNLNPENRKKFVLPEIFEIYSYDCDCPFPVEAICSCQNGVWNKTEVVTLENAKQKKSERKDDFKKRVRWLEGNAT